MGNEQQMFTQAQAILSNSGEPIEDQLSNAVNQFQDIQSKMKSISSAKQNPSNIDSCKGKVGNCESFKYLLNTLIKYKQHAESKINMFDDVMKANSHNKYSGDIFGVRLLNEYHHLLYQHQDEFEDIYNLLNENIYQKQSCNLSDCLCIRRNHRDRLNIRTEGGLKEQILDMIHCYFMHSFDIGYRLTNNERLTVCDEKQIDEAHMNIRLMQQIINTKKKRFQTIGDEKISDNCCTKFITKQYSNGVRYYYWPFYKGKQNKFDPAASIPIKQNIAQNVGTLGYWYIEKKYENLKQELLHNQICQVSKESWDNIEKKAALYSQSNHATEMICLRNQSAVYYDMKMGDKIQSKHLIAMMLYTDFDELQRKFSQTFRKMSENETDEQLKDRHRNYHFWGKYLRECVECFGMKRCDMNLYHGIQAQCTFSSVYPYFKGPFSVTQSYSVAVVFSVNGMILELKIDKNAWRMRIDVDRMNCFDCSWVSRYPHEQEILFLGGLNRHTFQTIINVQTNVNYYAYVIAIRQMTYCTSNWNLPLDMLKPDKPTPKHKQMVFRLMSHEFYRYPKYRSQKQLAYEWKGCPEYIKRLLHEHCSNVKAIVFGEKLYPDSDKQNFIFKQFFQLENKWADLERLTTVFPQTEMIGFQFENSVAIANSLEITHQFIKNNIKENTKIPLRLIVVKVEGHNSVGKGEIKEVVCKYKETFAEIGWNLRARDINDDLVDSTVRDLGINVINSPKWMKEIQKFKTKETKLMKALTQGLIVDIKKA